MLQPVLQPQRDDLGCQNRVFIRHGWFFSSYIGEKKSVQYEENKHHSINAHIWSHRQICNHFIEILCTCT